MSDLLAQLPPFPYPVGLDLLAYAAAALAAVLLVLLLWLVRLSVGLRRATRHGRTLANRLRLLETAQARQAMQDVYSRHGRPAADLGQGEAAP